MTDARRVHRYWDIAFLAVLAVWIVCWRAAPFAGWDILFYVLLLAIFVTAYLASARTVEFDLRQASALPPSPKRESDWIGAEEDPFGNQPGWRKNFRIAFVVFYLTLCAGGFFYSAQLARDDWDWFAPRVGAPEGLVLLAYFVAYLRVTARWAREGKPVPEDY